MTEEQFDEETMKVVVGATDYRTCALWMWTNEIESSDHCAKGTHQDLRMRHCAKVTAELAVMAASLEMGEELPVSLTNITLFNELASCVLKYTICVQASEKKLRVEATLVDRITGETIPTDENFVLELPMRTSIGTL